MWTSLQSWRAAKASVDCVCSCHGLAVNPNLANPKEPVSKQKWISVPLLQREEMKSPFFQFFCSSCFSCHDCLCGIAPTARPAQHFQFDLVLSAYVWHSAHRDQAAGKETKLNVESNCQQKKGENSSFNAERMSYRHNLATRHRSGLSAELPPTGFGSCRIRSQLGPWRP